MPTPPPPQINDDVRRAAAVRAVEVRRARAAFKQELRDERLSLAEVFERAEHDEVVASTRISVVLGCLPRLGPTRTGRIMEQVRIAESRRVRGVGPKQRAVLLETVGRIGAGLVERRR